MTLIQELMNQSATGSMLQERLDQAFQPFGNPRNHPNFGGYRTN